MCRLADTEGEYGFQECGHKSWCTVQRPSYEYKSRGSAFSLTSARTLPHNHPPVNEATAIPSHLGLTRLSFSFTFLLSVQSNFTKPTPALRCSRQSCVGTTCGRGYPKSLSRQGLEKIVYLSETGRSELKCCSSWWHSPRCCQTQEASAVTKTFLLKSCQSPLKH